jgi:DNA-binding MarR family transcriptional regulator
MGSSKIEPALAEELRRMQAGDRATEAIPVVIEHIATLRAPEGMGREGLSELSREAHRAQQGLVNRLRELSVSDPIERAALANALFVSLTPAQIEAIAEHPDVRLIRWNRSVKVTT